MSEMVDLLGEALMDEMEFVRSLDPDDKRRIIATRNVALLAQQWVAARETDAKMASDAAKMENNMAVEEVKQRISWQRALLDILKVAIPAYVSIKTLAVWRLSFVEMINFEQSGRFTTRSSNEVRLPKIF